MITKDTFSHLLQRLKSPTPIFWKNIRARANKFGGSCIVAGMGIYQYQSNLPDLVINIGKYATAAGALIAFTITITASLTVEDCPKEHVEDAKPESK